MIESHFGIHTHTGQQTSHGLHVGPCKYIRQGIDNRQTQGVDTDPSFSCGKHNRNAFRKKAADKKNITHQVCVPLLDVYSKAAWKETTCISFRFSSMDIWTAKPASGFTLGRDSRSVERTKKFPWNVWMDRPAKTSNQN